MLNKKQNGSLELKQTDACWAFEMAFEMDVNMITAPGQEDTA